MKVSQVRYLLLMFIMLVGTGCANIVPPKGGKKDDKPPVLMSVTPADSQLNKKVTKIVLRYDEYVELKNLKDVQVSPLLQYPPTLTNVGRRVTIQIPDSLLKDSTTYRISFGKSIADLHEGNPIKPYTYVFSTTNYFDSLRLDGEVIDAATGKPDTGAIILLYPAYKSDSVVVREKPEYIGRVSAGKFTIAGLPDRPFRVYALKDANDNMTYDGEGEKIGFVDSIFRPSDTILTAIKLRVFAEKLVDTTDSLDLTDTADIDNQPKGRFGRKKKGATKDVFGYGVGVDTSSISKRTFDIMKPLTITFTADIDSINKSKISLTYDSVVSDTQSIEIDVPFSLDTDTVHRDILYVNAGWKENTIYTLRIQKGLAKDTAGTETLPSRHKFRTKSDDDYSKLGINIPAKYLGNRYILLIRNDKDTVYQKPVTDTLVQLVRLLPGGYSMFIIEDANENGQWDTGDLFEKRQPENVIPFPEAMQLKAAWESIFDFEVKQKKPEPKKGASPKKRDSDLGK